MNPFRVTVTFSHRYSAAPRAKVVQSVRTFDIPQVTSQDAPVVLRVPTRHFGGPLEWADVRGHDGRLFVPDGPLFGGTFRTEAIVVPGSPDAPAEVTDTFNHDKTEQDAIASLEADYATLLVIDGFIWKAIDEPVYQVRNSAGHTSLRITQYPSRDLPVHPVTDFIGAVAELVTTGTRTDLMFATDDVVIQNPVQVLDPSYVHTPVDETVSRDPQVLADVYTLQAQAALATSGLAKVERITAARNLLFQAAVMMDQAAIA